MRLREHLVTPGVTESQAKTIRLYKASFEREIVGFCTESRAGQGENDAKFFSLITVTNLMACGELIIDSNCFPRLVTFKGNQCEGGQYV